MFRLRLHPSPSGFLVGIAFIAFWALLWVWLFAQLVGSPARASRGEADPPQLTGLETSARARG